MTKGIDEASDSLRALWEAYGLLHLPYRMLILAKMLDRLASATILRGEHLALAEWRVMANLARTGQSTVNALAAATYVDRAEVSRASRSLEKHGLVARGSHPSSKAKRLLSLTEAGREMAARIGVQRRAFYTYLLDGMSEEDRQKLDDLLLHVAVRVEQYDAEQAAALANA
ncbi:MAG TPA: MarR family transcriptional regulator [Allosphingosinicella sp.]|nr:MarR family transcriptional regulator [Allosphingosinicella sp.]